MSELQAFPAATFSDYDGMVAALAAAKNWLGLSNEVCEQIGGLTKGHIDKLLGPSRVKNVGPLTLDILLELFAVQFVMQPNPDAARRMESRWERRNRSQIRVAACRASIAQIEAIKPIIFGQNAQRGGHARAASLTNEQRSRIARKAARARWRRSRAPPP